MALQSILPRIEAAGARLVTLSPQLPEYSRAWVEEDGIGFDVVPDLGLGVARTFGLTFRVPDPLKRVYLEEFRIDLPRFNGDESWELPIPASFLVDTGGTIRWSSADPDYTVRPEPEEVLGALDALTSS